MPPPVVAVSTPSSSTASYVCETAMSPARKRSSPRLGKSPDGYSDADRYTLSEPSYRLAHIASRLYGLVCILAFAIRLSID